MMPATNKQRRWTPSLMLAATALFALVAPLSAQNPTPRDPPAADQPDVDSAKPRRAKGQTEPELRKTAREMLAKRLENRRREIEKLQQALDLIDQGKSWDEVRSLIPDMPQPGQRADGANRWNDGGPGMQGEPINPPPRQGNNRAGEPSRPAGPLSAEDRETAREFLRLTAPRILAKVQDLEKTKPGEADQQYAETLRRARGFLELRKRDPQMYELRAKEIRNSRQAVEFAQAIAQMKSPDPDSVDYQAKFGLLRTALMEQHSIRSQIMKRELDKMTRELAERAAHTDENIDDAAHDLIDREKRKHEGKGGSAGGKDGPPAHESGDEPDDHKHRP